MKKEPLYTNADIYADLQRGSAYGSPYTDQREDLRTGFSVVEAVLAGAVFALIITAVVGAMLYGQEATVLAGARARAIFLAEEGLEAARNIRDASFANLIDGSHGLVISSNQWVFSGTQDITDVFTRQVSISAVDANTKQATATVVWQQNPQRSGLVSLVTRFTKWAALSIGNWATPQKEAALDLSGITDGLKIQLQGNYAFLVRDDTFNNFVSVNVTNTVLPSLAATISLGGNPRNIAISGNSAYVASTSDTQELQIINISNPAAPFLAGSFNASGTADALGVYAIGTTVYLVRTSSAQNEFLIIDAAVPSSSSLVGSFNLGANANEIVVLGSYAHIASTSNAQELQVVNISNPTTPALAGSFNLSGTTDALSITGFGSTVLVGRADSFLYIFNVSNPVSPALVGSFNAGGAVNDISLGAANTYAFLATSSATAEFRVVDISNPTAPVNVGLFNSSSILRGIAYDETKDRAYVVGNADTEEFAVMAPQ